MTDARVRDEKRGRKGGESDEETRKKGKVKERRHGEEKMDDEG